MQTGFTMKILQEILNRKNRNIRKPYGYDSPLSVQDFHGNCDLIIQEWKDYVALSSSIGFPIDELSEDQKHLNEDKKWKAFFVYIYGEPNPEAIKYFPQTLKLAQKWEKEIKTGVFFKSGTRETHTCSFGK
jgi:hypothetical protein